MERGTKDIGSRTCNMDQGKKSGQMEADIKGTTLRGKSMVKEPTFGQTEASTMATGTRIGSKAMAHTHGLMDVNTPGNG